MAPVEVKKAFSLGGLGLGILSDYPLPTLILAGLGALGVIRFTLSTLRMLAQLFILPGLLKKFGAKKGAWAVVTGATDGIGREFANQLAKAGFNVVLASRNPEKLRAAAADIESKYKVSTKTHAIDFSKPDDEAYEAFQTLVSELDIGVLVNNVGKSHDLPTYFHETPKDEIKDIVQININATLRVTQIVVPILINRKSGLIINLGSFSSMIPSPMLATYSGTKGFLTTWSQALGEELKSHGILVQLVNASFVVSSMSKIRRPTIGVPLPSVYVRSVLSHLGSQCGAVNRPFTTTPYWVHALQDWAVNSLGHLGAWITWNHGLHKDIRRRALRKRARELEASKIE